MQVLTSNIGQIVLRELKKAAEVHLAVALFSPNPSVLAALCAAPRLTLIISEEFTINDPSNLEKLQKNAIIRSVPSDSANGKLHAKVLIVKRRDGTTWALTGSANMTWHGLFSNQEACIATEDVHAVATLREWFNELLAGARQPDINAAKKIFASRALYRLERRPKRKTATQVRYWALKTTSGAYGDSHWEQFLAEDVVAIGWGNIDVDPSKVSALELREEFHGFKPEKPQSQPRRSRRLSICKSTIRLLFARAMHGVASQYIFTGSLV